MKNSIFGLEVSSRTHKKLSMILIDFFILNSAIFLAFSIRYAEWYWLKGDELWLLVLAPIVAFPVFAFFGLYRTVIRYLSFRALWIIFQTVSLYALIFGTVVLILKIDGFPRSVILINWLLVLLLIGGSRMVARWLLNDVKNINDVKNVVIYGAGSAGVQLSSALKSSEFSVVAFLDDDIELHNNNINGIKVVPLHQISKIINDKNVTDILLALPSISQIKRNNIIRLLEPYPVLVRTLPGMSALVSGKITINDLHEISIEDLLGRDTIPPNQQLLKENITKKSVLVTGAGGSIGSELCRQIIELNCDKLVLFELNELALYNIHQELQTKDKSVTDKIFPILGSINDQKRLETICNKFNIDTIYHAAAYKHVPMVEFNSTEGVINNIFGTLSCVNAAINCKVASFVLISTDKAVRPTNIMGATKRFAEMILQAMAKTQDKTRFVMVRFGNVLGSSGSVIPFFKEQIKAGGPVTVTDPKIIRYFMTISEASQLVIQAGSMGVGGEVFVLDMGEPVLILDLAKKMIHLSGMEVKNKANPDGDIEIIFTGLRPGEKLYEELLIDGNTNKTKHPMIMSAKEHSLSFDKLNVILTDLKSATDNYQYQNIRDCIKKAVVEFQPQCGIKDVLRSDN